jgi:MFS family permease
MSKIFGVVGKIWVLMILQVLYNTVSSVRMAVFFAYIRTTVSCDSALPMAAADSDQWSGSMLCTDKDLVAKAAQGTLGLAMGMNLLVQFVCLAALGALGDSFGRKPVLVLSWIGVLLET